MIYVYLRRHLENYLNIKQKVRKYRSSENIIVRATVSLPYKFWRAFQFVKSVCTDDDFRAVVFLKLFNSENVHQTTSLTFMNRYPGIFSACRDYLDGRENLKILSYGCSTGEEVLTLRQYFPDAKIVGAEINKSSLAICNTLPVDEKISFVYSDFSELEKYGAFDAVFCMAVLQRTPHHIESEGVRSLKKIYPFEKFERQIFKLDKLVKPQGLLVIKFTQYSFEDTSVAAKYDFLNLPKSGKSALVLFDKNSNLDSNLKTEHSIFVKKHN